jgi:hypothetical protein
VSMWNPSEYDGESFEREYAERREAKAEREIEQDEIRLRERLAEEEIHLIEAANGWTHAVRARRDLLADGLDPKTGCTAAEMKESWACAVCFKGKVA